MWKLLIVVLIFAVVVFSDSETQTQWSGGPGTPGPVSQWGIDFHTASGIDWSGSSDKLRLGYVPVIPIQHLVTEDYSGAFCVIPSDIDDDGDFDLVGSAYSQGTVSWWENSDTSPGLFIAQNIIDDSFTYAAGLHAEDIDADGFMDIVGAAAFDGEIAWWRNSDGSGNAWQKYTIDVAFQSAWSVHSADIDSDGDIDVLGAAHQDDIISWWENVDGTGTFWIEHIVDPSFDGSCSVRADDINGDGKPDILGAGRMADEIVWWENTDSSGTAWVIHTVVSGFDGACSVYSCDMDRDGDVDVIGAAYNEDALAWWENVDGTGMNWIHHQVDGMMDGAFFVTACDIDIDGCTDLVCCAEDDNMVAWYRNEDGSGTMWQKHVLDSTFTFATSVSSADLDLDGVPDVAATSFQDSEIAWWNVTGAAGSGFLTSSIFDSGGDANWVYITCSYSVSYFTSVNLQVRSSDDPGDMGAWSDTLSTTSILGPYTDPGDRYFQYKAILQTENPGLSPELYDIHVIWNPLGLEEHIQPGGFQVMDPSPNPSIGPVGIQVFLPEPTSLKVSVFDISGRLVFGMEEHFTPGIHEIRIEDLSDGIYFATIRGDDLSWRGRFAVID